MSFKHIIISGRVQGVGFRQFVFREGRRRNLNGWVRNLVDGRVEVLVELPLAEEDCFLNSLRQGPPSAQVSYCEIRELGSASDLTQFEIRSDGTETL